MKGVLVDTSVWVEHFRHSNDTLMGLLELDLAMTHPLIVGEIACGTPPNRLQTIANLESLHLTQQASMREAMAFIEREHLFGLGCGLVDLLLLASALVTTGVVLWTLDRRLFALAKRFGVAHQPAMH